MSTLALTLNSNYELESLNDLQELTDEIIRAYYKQLDVSDSTKKTYLTCIKKFKKWLLANEITSISYEVIVTYKNYLKENYKARATNTHLTAIKDLFKFLNRYGINNVAKNVKKERVSQDFNKDSLTIDQVKGILNNIDKSTLEGARAYALFKLLIGTGLRECEVVRANIEDLGVKGNTNVLYVRGKGETEKNKYVIITNSVQQALQNYFILRGNVKPSEPLFASCSDRNNGQRLTTRTIQRIIKGLYADNGIISDKITTHSTRHTAITLSILNGANVQQAQAMARHKDINTTMIYFHNLNRLQENAESKLESLFNNL